MDIMVLKTPSTQNFEVAKMMLIAYSQNENSQIKLFLGRFIT